MKTLMSTLMVMAMSAAVDASLTAPVNVEFDGSGTTTGDLFDEAVLPGTHTNSVQEGKGSGDPLENIDLTITIESTHDGDLNQTNDGFGINSDTISGDDTDGLDSGEDISFSFNFGVEVSRFDFQDFDSGDSIEYWVNNGPVSTIVETDLDSTTFDDITLSTPLLLGPSDSLNFSVPSGSTSVGFDEFTLAVDTSTIPEPASACLLAGFGLLALRRRRVA